MFVNDRVLFTTRLFSTVRLGFKLSLLKTEMRIGLTTSISRVVFSSLSLAFGLFQDRDAEKRATARRCFTASLSSPLLCLHVRAGLPEPPH